MNIDQGRIMVFTACILLVVVTISVLTVLGGQDGQPWTIQAFKNSFLQAYAKCDMEIASIFDEKGFSSIMDKKLLRKIIAAQRKYLVPLGPQALPYLIVLSQEGKWWLVKVYPETWDGLTGAIPAISKFQPHEIALKRVSQKSYFTTEEFPEIVEPYLPNPYRVHLMWWLEGEKRTPQWFTHGYAKWLTYRQQGDTKQAQAMYQKLLNIGIAAIPLWVQKLSVEQDSEIRQAILEALSYLTDGEVKVTMSPQECLDWWQSNKERWTIPFPKSKRDFLDWLEREGWEESRLTIPVVLTISRLEDEAAIDALLRFLKHPSPLVRAVALEQLQKLFGEQLPKEYALNVGTDEWERFGDLVELGKEDWVRKRIRETQERVKDLKEAEKVAEELSNWWARNRGKLNIYWHRTWVNLR
jgi:ferritin